jgi:hypothetical protein
VGSSPGSALITASLLTNWVCGRFRRLANGRKKSAIPLGARSPELNSQVLAGVNPLSPNHRFVIALRSLGGVFETGLPGIPSENRATKQAHALGRDVFSSPVQWENPKNCADFSYSSRKCSEVSLRS